MKKIYLLIISMICVSAVFCGCSGKEDSPESSSDNSISESETTAEPHPEGNQQDVSASVPDGAGESSSTEPENHPLERNIQPAEGTYVYDYASVFSAEDFSECNDYAEWLYENFLINTAVVTTDSIEGLTPEQYAGDVYNTLYGGRGSGLLLLINNDTNEDYLYKTGSCLNSIDDNAQANAFYWATQEIIKGDYKSAVMRIMQLGESCPKYVFDNGGIFSAEDISALEASLAAAPKAVSLLATSNGTGTPNEEICSSYYERRYQSEEGIMIMLDTATNTFTVCPAAALSAEVTTQANTLAAAGSYADAVNTLIAAIK